MADALLDSGDAFTLKQMFVRRIPKSAKTPEEMLKMCELDAPTIVKQTLQLLQVV